MRCDCLMKKKVIILVVLVIVFITAAVTGSVIFFRNADTASLDPLEEQFRIGDKSAKENSEDVKSLADTTLTFYFEAQEPKEAKEVLEQVAKKAGKRLNIALDFQYIWDYPEGYLQKVKQAIASGSPCDAFYFSNGFPVTLGSLVEDGTAMDITELFPNYAPNYYSKFSQEELMAASVKGKIHAVPHRWWSTQRRCAVVREDMMTKHNIPPINSYADYDVYLKTIKAKEPEMIPMTFYETAIGLFAEANGYVILDYELGLVYKWDDPGTKLLAWEQTPEFRKGIEMISHWKNSEYMLKDVGITSIDEMQITSGKWASFITTQGSEMEYNAIAKSKGKDWSYKAYPLYPDQISERSSPMGGAMVINAKSKNADRVLMFVEWLQSDQDNYDSLLYGIKGKHYELQGEQIRLPAAVKPQESLYSWPWRWPFENIDWERSETSTPGDTLANYKESIMKSTKYPPHMGFVPDYKSTEDIVAQRRLSFYSTEQKIYGGYFEQKHLEEYITEEKQSGADKLVSEIQRQLDKWKAENKE
jgi:putative aldouronate transport system substrate-binding protein